MFSSKCQRLEILFVIFAVLAFGAAASGQTITGSISGAVADSTGGYIPRGHRHDRERQDRTGTNEPNQRRGSDSPSLHFSLVLIR